MASVNRANHKPQHETSTRRHRSLSTRALTRVAVFAALTAVGAFVRIPLPYVPFTLQTFFVLFAGSLLGSRLGLLSQVIYLALGLMGLPIFAHGGGPSYVLHPSFGYLLGFAAAAYIIGLVVERANERSLKTYLLANLLGLGIIYLIGLPYLHVILNNVVGVEFSLTRTLWAGMVVFLPGDFLKALVAARAAADMAYRLPF